MVCDRLRVRRADADVHQRDARAIIRHQVIGRHLVTTPRTVIHNLRRILGLGINDDAARRRQLLVRTRLLEPFDRPFDEVIDIAMIVREQDVALHMLERRAGIVFQALQGKIDTRGIEQRQRPHAIGIEDAAILDLGVDDLIADVAQARGWKPARELRRRQGLGVDRVRVLQHVRIGDLGLRDDDVEFDDEVGRDLLQLLQEVIPEEFRLGDCGGVEPRLRQLGEGPRQRRHRAIRVIRQPQLGIAEVPAHPGCRIGRFAPCHECFKRRT